MIANTPPCATSSEIVAHRLHAAEALVQASGMKPRAERNAAAVRHHLPLPAWQTPLANARAQDARGLRNSAGHEQHDEGERRTVEDETKIAESAQELGQDGERNRAADRADQRAHAADDHHGKNGEQFGDDEGVGNQRADEARIERAGGARNR